MRVLPRRERPRARHPLLLVLRVVRTIGRKDTARQPLIECPLAQGGQDDLMRFGAQLGIRNGKQCAAAACASAAGCAAAVAPEHLHSCHASNVLFDCVRTMDHMATGIRRGMGAQATAFARTAVQFTREPPTAQHKGKSCRQDASSNTVGWLQH